ncbi:hypothetical protein QAD02_018170 [Eretmocerus hayati]|uniref:Uncharacterized protein n=1 Tax=Eretmocerus hayati TaxID=131215 RepID=A0ACC2PH69_9HYME|nr:hypothetical protein QAD02_018170 [Eretmocerus hayati]
MWNWEIERGRLTSRVRGEAAETVMQGTLRPYTHTCMLMHRWKSMRKSRDIKPIGKEKEKGISEPMHQLNASTLEEQNSVLLIMDQNTTEVQTCDDQDRSNNSVLSNLTADEMQIVNELCELEVNIDMDCSNNASGPVLDEPYNATHGSWDNNVEQIGEDIIKNQRIKEIEYDLKKYEQLDEATQSKDIIWQLGLVENTTIYTPQTPNGSVSTGGFDACTPYNTSEPAYGPINMEPISEYNETMRQCTTSYASNSIEQSIRNAANVNPTDVIAPQSENMHNAGSIDELSRIYSIEIRGEYPATQSQDIPVNSRSICTPTVWEEIEEEGQTSGRRNEQRSSQETPPTDSENTTTETSEIKKLLSSANLITTGGKTCNIRLSGRERRNVNASCSREDMVRARYSNIEELRVQSENNKPNLNHPFWQNLKAFVCARSVFWKKEKQGTICPFPYVDEKHKNLGYKMNSKHVLIRSYRNPQMPVCTICHESRYHVQDAEKCEFCVKAYFELNIESEQGEMEEIIDVWP